MRKLPWLFETNLGLMMPLIRYQNLLFCKFLSLSQRKNFVLLVSNLFLGLNYKIITSKYP